MTRILLLGGTTEAGALAQAMQDARIDAVYSYAGRTQAPVAQPLPTRKGGFGGVEGLARYLVANDITHVVDATHPFAAQMSWNTFEACRDTQRPLIRLERPAWAAGPGDDWHMVPKIEAIPEALPDAPARVFLAIGKQQIGLFAAKPQHHYLLRLIDAPEAPLPVPEATVVLARGPFKIEGDLDLMRDHGITHVVAKNAGGSAARAKLDAARMLGLPVILAERPAIPGDNIAASVREVLDWLPHDALRGV
jgi:precorrin-6A/cobalt-precorrin-6A reductase